VGLILDEAIGFFNSSNPSSRSMIMGLTQPLTEMSIFLGCRGHKADDPTAICEPIV
jgi:hypothetical protein